MSIEVFLTEQQRRLAREVLSWAKTVLYPDPGNEEDPNGEGLRLLAKMAEAGWLRYTVPAAHGGAEQPLQSRSLAVIRDALSRGSSLADTMFALQGLGSYPITLAGTDAQRKRFLPPVAAGESVAAFALTEPEAGSDIGAIQTRAEKKGDRYILNGTKCFISNAGIANLYLVFASTSPADGAKGLSAFVVEGSAPGLVLKEQTALVAPHPNGTIAFENCAVDHRQRLGEEGQGIKIALTTLDKFRPTVGAAACGLACRALEEAIAYSQKRKQFGNTLASYQAIQFKLAEMATRLDASRLLVFRAAHAGDTVPGRSTLESAMAKLHATEAAQWIIDQAVQIHGGQGVRAGSAVERLYREVRGLRIYEGTSEIQHLVIARELLKKYGSQ
ncbi:MAG: acyl-CoA dehydrogenase family protein [Acidobacteriota bacterium]